MKESRRRPAAALLRLATLLDFRPSRNETNEFDAKRLKSEDIPTHITPEVLNSLTGLEAVGP